MRKLAPWVLGLIGLMTFFAIWIWLGERNVRREGVPRGVYHDTHEIEAAPRADSSIDKKLVEPEETTQGDVKTSPGSKSSSPVTTPPVPEPSNKRPSDDIDFDLFVQSYELDVSKLSPKTLADFRARYLLLHKEETREWLASSDEDVMNAIVTRYKAKKDELIKAFGVPKKEKSP